MHLRFEPELEAQKNVVLLELHSIPPATNIEETKAKLVELRCRIAKAEDILGEPIQEMQKRTALLQVIDPITKQHTATLKELDFSRFYTVIMNFTNNASMGVPQVKPVNSVNENTGRTDQKEDEEPGGSECDKESHDDGWLNGMNRAGQCHNCGKYGHWARDCPKGKGKGEVGYGGGQAKGKGKGKGPSTGCWQCGGDHYQSQCPKGGKAGGSKGGGKGMWTSKGKGKGGINGLNEYTNWDTWDNGYSHIYITIAWRLHLLYVGMKQIRD